MSVEHIRQYFDIAASITVIDVVVIFRVINPLNDTLALKTYQSKIKNNFVLKFFIRFLEKKWTFPNKLVKRFNMLEFQ